MKTTPYFLDSDCMAGCTCVRSPVRARSESESTILKSVSTKAQAGLFRYTEQRSLLWLNM